MPVLERLSKNKINAAIKHITVDAEQLCYSMLSMSTRIITEGAL